MRFIAINRTNMFSSKFEVEVRGFDRNGSGDGDLSPSLYPEFQDVAHNTEVRGKINHKVTLCSWLK